MKQINIGAFSNAKPKRIRIQGESGMNFLHLLEGMGVKDAEVILDFRNGEQWMDYLMKFTLSAETLKKLGITVRVESHDKCYQSIGGMLYSKDGSVLFRCLDYGCEDAVIKEGTQTIIGDAFEGIPLKSVRFPESLAYIAGKAFPVDTLHEVWLPKNVVSVGFRNFPGATKIIQESERPINGLLSAMRQIWRFNMPFNEKRGHSIRLYVGSHKYVLPIKFDFDAMTEAVDLWNAGALNEDLDNAAFLFTKDKISQQDTALETICVNPENIRMKERLAPSAKEMAKRYIENRDEKMLIKLARAGILKQDEAKEIAGLTLDGISTGAKAYMLAAADGKPDVDKKGPRTPHP